ncbi:DUF2314 domain-containing protein [Pseudomonas entomophila]|uniref:DUF2314 domain-containing protein n=1 Tax=Pseudomonas entomophila TaxID=312306 RepID=UPI0015E38637|nr:DUF2314 domain-containing protein [Pseudomonas entomophila]MBA1187987.1 DUF2314 domain-containing protein [Pseudomonas entomophila]
MTEQTIYTTSGDSPALQTAVANAQATFKFFWRELSWESRRIVKGLSLAAVKMSFPVHSDDPEVPTVENMWLNEVDFDGASISGMLLNEPEWATGFDASERVTLPFAALNDWMYVCGEVVFGGFTVDAMRSEMADGERAEHDAAWGLEFGPPGAVELTMMPEGQPRVRLSRALDTPADQEALKRLEEGDHPMAVNMSASMDDMLREHPGAVTDVDEAGWSLLHREALAGNAPMVSALLRHGADASARTVAGQTPVQLAEQAGWPRVARLLRGEEALMVVEAKAAAQVRPEQEVEASTQAGRQGHAQAQVQAPPQATGLPRWVVGVGVAVVAVVVWWLIR